MNYGSVCSGIEAATVAWHPLGWTPAFYSEIEAFPNAVLKHHWGKTPNLGDMNGFKKWPTDPIDVLVGGTPCQSFSVAGLRKGLADPRGNLTLVFLAVVDRLRPRWVVWENVPGILSDDEGRSFGAFLGGLGQLGYGFAYCIRDAQYFGVPQRRRRPFVVGHLGDWRRAAAVLLERHGLSGNPPPSREAGEGVAPSLAARTRGGGGLGTDFDRDGGLVAKTLLGKANLSNAEDADTLIPAPPVSHCLNAGAQGRQDYETETLIPTGGGFDQVKCGCWDKDAWHRKYGMKPGEVCVNYGVAHSLSAEGHDASEDGTGRGTPIIAAHETGQGFWQQSDVAGTLRAEGENRPSRPSNIVAFDSKASGRNGFAVGEVSPTLRAMGKKNSHSNAGGQVAIAQTAPTMDARAGRSGENGFNTSGGLVSQAPMSVRRLTPRECERLQGFPDDYTLIPYRSKPAADGPRYKALGNSMAVPVMTWIGRRIQQVEAIL